MPASSIFVRYSSTTEASSSPSSLRIDSICLRRKYSRCCFSAPDWTSSRMRARTCSSASRSRWSVEGQLEALGHVERLEHLDLLVVGEVGRVAGRVGERARLGDRADEGGHAAVVAAQLEELLDHGAVLALEVAGAPVDGHVVGVRLDLHAQRAGGVGARGADAAAVQALERHGTAAAGQADALDDVGDGAHAGELVALARHEHHALVVADVDRERHGHVGEDDGVVYGDQQKVFHLVLHAYDS